MKLAHLILAHSNPGQLQKLVHRLSHSDTDIYIHLDKKTNISLFSSVKEIPNVFFIQKRIKVFWGAYSIVSATLEGFREILASQKKYDYINLLSGQDYPIKPIEHIHSFLAGNPNKAFMEFYDIEKVWTEALPRITEYHLTQFRFIGKHFLQRIINRVLPKRQLPLAMIGVGRSQWFTISTGHVEYIVDFLSNNPKIVRFFKFTWGADEFIFQTILFNSPHKQDMVNNNLRYIDWAAGGASPKTLSIEDGKVLLACDKLFARKFSGVPSDPLQELIHKYTDQKNNIIDP